MKTAAVAVLACTFFAVCGLSGGEPEGVDQIAKQFSALLKRKGTRFPYAATYEFDMPLAARPAAAKSTRFFFSDAKASTYCTENTDQYASRVLLRDATLHWEYVDDSTGPIYFRGTLKQLEGDTEAILRRYQFFSNVYSDIDPDLVSWTKGILRGAKQVSIKKTANGTECQLTSNEMGRLVVRSTESSFEISRIPSDRDKVPELVLRYTYVHEKPESLTKETEAFNERFARAEKEGRIRVVGPEFTYSNAFEILNRERGIQPIELGQLRQIATKLGYLLPTGKDTAVTSARGVVNDFPVRQIELVVRNGYTEFTINEFIPPIRRENLPDHYVKGRRKLGAYDVLLFVDPVTGAKQLYYIGKDVSFITPGDDFRNDALDALVLGCRRVPGPR